MLSGRLYRTWAVCFAQGRGQSHQSAAAITESHSILCSALQPENQLFWTAEAACDRTRA